MPADQQNPPSPTSTLRAYWRLICQAYRHANRITHHVLGFMLKTLVLVWLVFGGLFLSLRYVVLPNIDVYKENIEQLASRAVGRPVSIARIYASWDGLRPHLILGDVVLRDKDGRAALSLPGISATLSWWSLVVADLRFHSLEISRPDLDIRREADGKLYVAGIYLDPGKSGDGKGLDWVLSQDQIVIREGSLHWTDQRRAAPELVLEHVTLLLQNQWRHHKFGFKATPPPTYAAPLDIRADFVLPIFRAGSPISRCGKAPCLPTSPIPI